MILRVCIIGDSNSTPHQLRDGKLWHIKEMYWYELTKLDFEVIPIAFVRNSTKRILQMSDFFIKHTHADIFIIQIGVNDLTETVITKNKQIDTFYKIITKLKFRNVIRKVFYTVKRSLIQKSSFETDLDNLINFIKKYNDVKKFIFLSIPYGIPERNEHIIDFNSRIERIAKAHNGIFINYFFEQQSDPSLVSDDMHYSIKLHQIISKKLIEILVSLNNSKATD